MAKPYVVLFDEQMALAAQAVEEWINSVDREEFEPEEGELEAMKSLLFTLENQKYEEGKEPHFYVDQDLDTREIYFGSIYRGPVEALATALNSFDYNELVLRRIGLDDEFLEEDPDDKQVAAAIINAGKGGDAADYLAAQGLHIQTG